MTKIEKTSRWHWPAAVFDWVRDPVQEYMSILGDPASATFGAFHEIWSDVMTMRSLSLHGDRKLIWLQRRAHWVAALIGDIKFNGKTGWTPLILDAAHSLENETTATKLMEESRRSGSIKRVKISEVFIQPLQDQDESEVSLTPSSTLFSTPADAARHLDNAIDITLDARPGFALGVLIPVILLLASSLGDKDKALSLAYCVWYSWILIVSVGGNCFATSSSSELAKKAFRGIVIFDKEANDKDEYGKVREEGSVALRDRYTNSQRWEAWARHSDGTTFDLKSRLNDMLSKDWKLFLWFAVGQFLGFCSVAFASACGIAIAWMTQTVGLGCRSFNFIMYASMAFVIAGWNVLRSWTKLRLDHRRMCLEDGKILERAQFISHTVNGVYWFLVFANSLVLILRTLFHLLGVFRTCWCERLPWTGSTFIELNSKTSQAVENAKRYWISTAYVAFGVEWLLCLVAIAGRRYIVLKMDQWPESDEKMREDSFQIGTKSE